MNCSTSGFLALHYLLEFAQTHVHWVSDDPTISSSVVPFSSCLQSFPASGSFTMSQLFASGGHFTEVSVSESVFPMNIQDWFPLGLTGLISLLSKGLLRVLSSTTIWKASVLWHSAFFTPFYFSLFISALLSFHQNDFPSWPKISPLSLLYCSSSGGTFCRCFLLKMCLFHSQVCGFICSFISFFFFFFFV